VRHEQRRDAIRAGARERGVHGGGVGLHRGVGCGDGRAREEAVDHQLRLAVVEEEGRGTQPGRLDGALAGAASPCRQGLAPVRQERSTAAWTTTGGSSTAAAGGDWQATRLQGSPAIRASVRSDFRFMRFLLGLVPGRPGARGSFGAPLMSGNFDRRMSWMS
jgi:hypothetical protein